MPATDIHIDSIQLTVRGISPAIAQSAVSSLGPALHAAITAQLATDSDHTPVAAHIPHVTAAPIRLPAGTDSAALQHALIGQIATVIASRLRSTNNT